MKKWIALTLFLSLALPAVASAQDARDLNLLHFKKVADPFGGVTLESARGLGHLKWYVGGMFSYAYLPLTLEVGDDHVGAVVGHQALMDLTLSFGLWNRLQLGAHLQAVMYQAGDDPEELGLGGGEMKSLAFADVRLTPKVLLLAPRAVGPGLAFVPVITLPTATADAGAGEDGLTVEPRLVADWRLAGGALVMGQVGYRWREGAEVANLRVDDELTWGLGAEVPLAPRFSAVFELFGAVGLKDAGDDPDSGIDLEEAPAEVVLAGRWRQAQGLIVTLGAGGGLTRGYGSPRARVFVSAGYTPFPEAAGAADRDGDGLPDTADKCPAEPEDKNGFEDADGCPDGTRDTDGDQIPDAKDRCPAEAEDANGFEDADGCPDGARDTDGDLIPDAKDKCPAEAEDLNGFEDTDGCPDGTRDTDGDQIPDAKDRCPTDPEDRDNSEDGDGCPDADNDGDGFCDPWVGEKNLQEKFADTCKGADKCPNEKEIINGVEDDDGCPDKGQEKIQITKSSIILLDKIFFKTAKADLLPQSFPILDMVVSVMKQHTQIELIEIQGHTDDVGDDDRNLKLSDDRTKSVMNYLVSKGVDARRLTQKGFGENMPLADCKPLRRKALDECRAKNRRVEFKILRMGKAKGE